MYKFKIGDLLAHRADAGKCVVVGYYTDVDGTKCYTVDSTLRQKALIISAEILEITHEVFIHYNYAYSYANPCHKKHQEERIINTYSKDGGRGG